MIREISRENGEGATLCMDKDNGFSAGVLPPSSSVVLVASWSLWAYVLCRPSRYTRPDLASISTATL